MKSGRWILALTLCVELFCGSTLPARAEKYYVWEYPVSGDFNDPNKWRHHEGNTSPAAGDFVQIIAGSDYTVTVNGAAAATTSIGGHVTLQLDGAFNAGDLGIGGGVVLRGAGTLSGSPVLLGSNGLLEEYDVLVDGAGLTMNGMDLSSIIKIIGRNGAKIISSGLTDRNGTTPFLESGAEWRHTGRIYGGLCTINSGALLTTDVANFTRAQIDGGRLQAGRLTLGGLEASNGATLNLTTADVGGFKDVVLQGGGTRMTVSGELNGPISRDVKALAGAVISAGSLASSGNAFYVVDGSGSQLSVASSIDRAIITMSNLGRGNAATLSRSTLKIMDAGSVFNVSDRIVDAIATVQHGARVNAGLGLGSGFTVDGMGSVVVLSGNLDTSPSGVLASVSVTSGGRLDCALANAGGSVYGADSFWRVGKGLIVGKKEEVYLNLGDGGRVEVHGPAAAVGLKKGEKGNVVVDGGLLASPSVLDMRQVEETGIGVEGQGLLRVNRKGRMVANKLTLGVEKNSEGTVEVFGLGTSLDLADTLEIGRAGTGQMEISGGLVAAQDVLIGSNPGTNLMRLTFSGSTMTVAKSLQVGVAGSGRLSIEAGSRVTVTGKFGNEMRCDVAAKPGSSGTIIVTGTGSTLVSETTELVVGAAGAGTLNVTKGGTVEFPVIVIGNGPGVSGMVTISGVGSAIHATHRILIGGTNHVAQGPGDVTVSDGGLLRTDSNLNVYKPATLRLTGGGAIVGQTAEAAIPGTVLVGNQGLFFLGGKVIGSVLVRPGGQLLPGSSPGLATVEGDVTLADGTALELELGGRAAGLGYDQIVATGAVTLGGRLDLAFRDGFAPVAGQTFEVARGGTVTGTFSAVSVRGLAPGFTYTLVNTDGKSLRLSATSTGAATTTPELSITRSTGDQVVVSWPDYVNGWTLESAAALRSESWHPVAAPGNTVSLPAAAAADFFRLTSP